MPNVQNGNRFGGLDSLIDATVRHWKLNPHPNPRSTLGPTAHAAGVGFYGTRPEHTGDFHELAAVLAGTKDSTSISPDFFGSSVVGQRMQTRLRETGHSIQPAGNSISVARAAVRYSKADGVAHPLVRGFRLETALRHLTTDSAASTNTRQLAETALYGNPDNEHDHDAVTGSLHALHDSLQEDDHPLAHESRWLGAHHKVLVDSAVGDAVNAVAASVEPGVDPELDLDPHHIAVLTLHAANDFHDRPRDNSPSGFALPVEPHEDIAADAVRTLRQHLSHEDLRRSLGRHLNRLYDAHDLATGVTGAIKHAHAAALHPEPWSPDLYARKTVRTPIHELIRGTRLAVVLKGLAGDQDSEVAALAKNVLRGGDLNSLSILHDKLQEIDHPILNLNYNFHAASHKLKIDKAVKEFMSNRVKKRFRENRTPYTSHENGVNQLRTLYHDAVESRGYYAFTYGVPESDPLRQHLSRVFGSPVSSKDVADSLARLRTKRTDYTERRNLREAPDSEFRQERAEWERKRITQKATAPAEENIEPVTPGPFSNIPARRNFNEKATRFSRSGGADFVSALNRVRSRNQQALRTVAEALQKKLKLQPAVTKDAIHDRPGAATTSVAQALEHDGDRDRVRLLGAWTALQTQNPSMLVFHAGEGEDAVYRVTANGSGNKMRAAADKVGLRQRLFIPHDRGFHILFYSPQDQHQQQVQAFARAVGGSLTAVRGTGEIIGGGDGDAVGDETSRRKLRGIITAHERKQQEKVNAGVQPQSQPAATAVAGYPGATAPYANAGAATAA